MPTEAPMNRTLLPLLTVLSAGCLATKSTVYLVKAEQALVTAKAAEAEVWAPYQWAQADAFMRKAREEWGYSDFGAAEELSKKVETLSAQAAEVARQNQAANTRPGELPERAKKLLTPPPGQRDGEQPATPVVQPAPAPAPTNTPWGGQ